MKPQLRAIGRFISVRAAALAASIDVLLGRFYFRLIAICLPGITYNHEGPIEEVWTPEGSASRAQMKYMDENYGDLRVATIVALPPGATAEKQKDQKAKRDILNHKFLLALLQIHEKIVSAVVTAELEDSEQLAAARPFNFSEVCFRPFVLSGCYVHSILSLWDFDSKKLLNDPDIHGTVTRTDKGADFLGGIERDAEGGIVSAEAALHAFINRGASSDEKLHVAQLEAWEGMFLEFTDESAYDTDALSIFRFARRSQKDEVTRATKADQILFVLAGVIMLTYVSLALGKFDWIHSRAWIGFGGILVVFLSIGMGFGIGGYMGFPYSVVCIATPFLILGVGVDDMFILTEAFDTQVAKTRGQGMLVHDIATALAKCGSSITMTSVTDFVAFFVGSNSSLPALHGFCAFAAVCILCDFFLQVTLFVGMLTLNERRARRNRLEILPCIPAERFVDINCICSRISEPPTGRNNAIGACLRSIKLKFSPGSGDSRSFVGQILYEHYAPRLLTKRAKVAVLILTAAFGAFSIFGSTQLPGGLSNSDVLPADSYMRDFIFIEELYFNGFNSKVDIVFTGFFDYSNETYQDAILDVTNLVFASDLVVPERSHSWLKSFLDWLPSSLHSGSLSLKGRPKSKNEFYLFLFEFLTTTAQGRSHADDLVLQYGVIKTSRIRSQHIALSTDTARADAILRMRQMVATAAAQTGGAVNAFPFCRKYVFWEQFVGLVSRNAKNFAIVAVAIFIVAYLFLGNATLAFVVLGCVFIVDIDMLGVMYVWGIALNNVSLTNMLLALGLAVDSVAHVTHAVLMTSFEEDEPPGSGDGPQDGLLVNASEPSSDDEGEQGTTVAESGASQLTVNVPSELDNLDNAVELRHQRIRAALGGVGSAVFSGSLTSFLGICALGFSDHPILVIFFKFFFAVFLLAMFHGLCVLPVLLSFVDIGNMRVKHGAPRI